LARYIPVSPGDVFGDLTVLGISQKKGQNAKCVVACLCGSVTVKWKYNLTSGHSLSCGCRKVTASAKAHLKHGHTVGGKWSPTYQTWSRVFYRVGKAKGYEHVSICDRWKVFENFVEDMGERPEGKTLDRFPDLAGDYEPGNCRWATPAEQSLNRRKWKHSDEFLQRVHLNFQGRT
jgi:hypothetical protein